MTMTRRLSAIVVASLVLGAGRVTYAQSTSVRVSGSPALMEISSAVAGSTPNPVVEASTTYTVKNSSNSNAKLTAQLSAAMPAGVTLTATFGAPSGSTSIPNVVLDGTARDVVTNITANKTGTQSITYTLTATLDAGVVTTQTRTLMLTLVSVP